MPPFQRLLRRQRRHAPHALFATLGFVPIGSLCIALFGVIPLHWSAIYLVLPLPLWCCALGLRYRSLGRYALIGFLCGLAATAIYDLVRFALIWAIGWRDFIPVIGRLAFLDERAGALWGYLYRYFGNGGCMGMTFGLLPFAAIRNLGLRYRLCRRPPGMIVLGLAYGVIICCCLFLTLLLAPGAQQTLFVLNPLTGIAAMIGHLVYGGVLGWALRTCHARWGLCTATDKRTSATTQPTAAPTLSYEQRL